MNIYRIWTSAQISVAYYLGIWQCARYVVAALFKELALISIREMWGLGLELPGLCLGFYDSLGLGGYGLDYITDAYTTTTAFYSSQYLLWRECEKRIWSTKCSQGKTEASSRAACSNYRRRAFSVLLCACHSRWFRTSITPVNNNIQ